MLPPSEHPFLAEVLDSCDIVASQIDAISHDEELHDEHVKNLLDITTAAGAVVAGGAQLLSSGDTQKYATGAGLIGAALSLGVRIVFTIQSSGTQRERQELRSFRDRIATSRGIYDNAVSQSDSDSGRKSLRALQIDCDKGRRKLITYNPDLKGGLGDGALAKLRKDLETSFAATATLDSTTAIAEVRRLAKSAGFLDATPVDAMWEIGAGRDTVHRLELHRLIETLRPHQQSQDQGTLLVAVWAPGTSTSTTFIISSGLASKANSPGGVPAPGRSVVLAAPGVELPLFPTLWGNSGPRAFEHASIVGSLVAEFPYAEVGDRSWFPWICKTFPSGPSGPIAFGNGATEVKVDGCPSRFVVVASPQTPRGLARMFIGLPNNDPLNLDDFVVTLRADAVGSTVPTAALIGLFWASGSPYNKVGAPSGGISTF